MRARLGRVGVVRFVALAIAAPALASHSYPATYSGAFAGRGAVSFDVSADGAAVTRVIFNPCEPCGSVNINSVVNGPIVDHAFSYSFGSLTISGTFPAR